MENAQQEVQVMEVTAIEHVTKAEIDSAIATARRFPRSIQAFQKKLTTMACLDVDVAASSFYKLQRDGRSIEGPSVRFAEMVAASYGNLRFGARIIEEGLKFVTAQGVAHDLENNVQVTNEVRRRITTKAGIRYNDDMVAMTANAACSIALRNAIFKAVPFSLAKSVYDQAKKTAIGDVKTLAERRTKMLAAFAQIGVNQARLFAAVNVRGIEDIDLALLEDLLGRYTAIRDGDAEVETEFPEPKKTETQPQAQAAAPTEQGAQPAQNAAAGLAAGAAKTAGEPTKEEAQKAKALEAFVKRAREIAKTKELEDDLDTLCMKWAKAVLIEVKTAKQGIVLENLAKLPNKAA